MPVPATYLAAAATGAGLGVVLQLLLGWPWWAAMLVFLAITWLVFMSTMFWGFHGNRPELLDDLLHVVNPTRALARSERQMGEAFRSHPFPLYGLPPDWKGPRMLGRSARSNKTVGSLELVHGDSFSGQGPQLRVEVSQEEGPQNDRRHLAIRLWQEAVWPPRDLPPEQLQGWHHRFEQGLRSRVGHWEKRTLHVDDMPTEFDWLADGAHWVAIATIDAYLLIVRGRHFPVEDVDLRTIENVEPYIEGHRSGHL